jgi:hypothetical protein
LVVVIETVVPAAFAQTDPSPRPEQRPSTRPAGTEPAADEREAEAVKRAMRSFLAEAATRRYEHAAATYCHAEDEAERVMAYTMAQLFFSQHVCRLSVKNRLGPEVAAQAFDLLERHDVDGASVFIDDRDAVIRFARGVQFPMVKVEGRWKISMAGFCEQEKTRATALAYGYLQMSQGHLAATQDVQAGRCADAAAVKAAIRLRISEADEALRKRREQDARAE